MLQNAFAAGTIIAASLVFAPHPAAQTTSATPSFEVATVRQNPNADPNQGQWSIPGTGSFKATAVSLQLLIRLAYGINATQIVNAPRWLTSNLYDVVAKPEAGIKLSREELRPRLQSLLQQRFHLVAHKEIRSEPGYALRVSKHGPALTPTHGAPFPGFRSAVNPGRIKGLNWTMTDLTKNISQLISLPVVDQTGLPGSYDINIEYAPDDQTDSQLPSLFTALTESTGLRLVSGKVPVEVLVIDSVDPTPTPN